MNMLNRFSQRATLCGGALLLCFSLAAGADEIQDISKLFKQGQNEQALARVNSYLTSNKKDAQARFLKGLILTEQNKISDAIKEFSDLTQDFPELPEPYNNLAVLYASQGQYDKAKIALEMAIRTHPSYATAHENLGDIYAKMASQAYDRALQLDHSNASTQTKLAMVKEIFNIGATKGGKADSHKSSVSDTVVATAATTTKVASSDSHVAAPEKTATHKPTAPNSRKDVLKVVNQWAAAWSAQNVKRYLAFYADDFNTPDGLSRAGWEAQRHARLTKPRSIRVRISDAKVSFIDDNHASVTFKQGYRASHFSSYDSKTLTLVKSGGSWLIQDEQAGK